MIFSKIPDISLTAVKFPDISRFSRQVVTLYLHSYIVKQRDISDCCQSHDDFSYSSQPAGPSELWAAVL